jgi:hypothetical protein
MLRDELLNILEKFFHPVNYTDFQISVEQGLSELRKLGVEHRLWEGSRKEVDQNGD